MQASHRTHPQHSPCHRASAHLSHPALRGRGACGECGNNGYPNVARRFAFSLFPRFGLCPVARQPVPYGTRIPSCARVPCAVLPHPALACVTPGSVTITRGTDMTDCLGAQLPHLAPTDPAGVGTTSTRTKIAALLAVCPQVQRGGYGKEWCIRLTRKRGYDSISHLGFTRTWHIRRNGS